MVAGVFTFPGHYLLSLFVCALVCYKVIFLLSELRSSQPEVIFRPKIWKSCSLCLKPQFQFITLVEKIDASSTVSETLSARFHHIFHTFFVNCDNATTSKETSEFRKEMLNILSAFKFAGSHLAFSEWKVRFSLISENFFTSVELFN